MSMKSTWGRAGAQDDGDQRVQVGQAVRALHQHADQRQDVPAGRGHGRAQEIHEVQEIISR